MRSRVLLFFVLCATTGRAQSPASAAPPEPPGGRMTEKATEAVQAPPAQAPTEEREDNAGQAPAPAQREKEELRARLLQQLNAVLDTTDGPRGLVVSMSDVLFDSAQYTLRPLARERLARIAGIIQMYPDLRLAAEGHTDDIGSESFNRKLSEKRVQEVKQYLVSQGIPETAIAARGFGESQPVADNRTAKGRQRNRRVELIVSGEAIGVRPSGAPDRE